MVSGLIGGTGVSVLSRVAEVNRAEHELVPIPNLCFTIVAAF